MTARERYLGAVSMSHQGWPSELTIMATGPGILPIARIFEFLPARGVTGGVGELCHTLPPERRGRGSQIIGNLA